MRWLILILLMFFCSASTGLASEILIIVNQENQISSLDRKQIIDLYMGRYQNFPNGEAAFPLDQPPVSKIRALFYKELVNKSVAQMNAYWAKILFTGRASPPRVMPDSAAVIKAVQQNKGAIGYINSANLNDSVKVVGRAD
jgi:ABC-type phosphate transport system substrate-binding protein